MPSFLEALALQEPKGDSFGESISKGMTQGLTLKTKFEELANDQLKAEFAHQKNLMDYKSAQDKLQVEVNNKRFDLLSGGLKANNFTQSNAFFNAVDAYSEKTGDPFRVSKTFRDMFKGLTKEEKLGATNYINSKLAAAGNDPSKVAQIKNELFNDPAIRSMFESNDPTIIRQGIDSITAPSEKAMTGKGEVKKSVLDDLRLTLQSIGNQIEEGKLGDDARKMYEDIAGRFASIGEGVTPDPKVLTQLRTDMAKLQSNVGTSRRDFERRENFLKRGIDLKNNIDNALGKQPITINSKNVEESIAILNNKEATTKEKEEALKRLEIENSKIQRKASNSERAQVDKSFRDKAIKDDEKDLLAPLQLKSELNKSISILNETLASRSADKAKLAGFQMARGLGAGQLSDQERTAAGVTTELTDLESKVMGLLGRKGVKLSESELNLVRDYRDMLLNTGNNIIDSVLKKQQLYIDTVSKGQNTYQKDVYGPGGTLRDAHNRVYKLIKGDYSKYDYLDESKKTMIKQKLKKDFPNAKPEQLEILYQNARKAAAKSNSNY